MSASTQPLYLVRQPIVDGQQELRAFGLRFVAAALDPASFANAVPATATAVVAAFAELDLAGALGTLDGVIDVDGDFLADPAIETLPPAQLILALDAGVDATPATLARCEALRGLGFRIAIAAASGADDPRAALFALADTISVDLAGCNDAALPMRVSALGGASCRLLASGVDTPERFALCKSAGFDLFAGYFFARPTTSGGRKLDSSKVVLMKLLAQIIEDADTPVLENSFKQAPGLSINLLRLVNSVASGLKVRISSLRHAITVLGRRQLQRWLQLLLYTDPSGATRLSNPLLQLAATRGRLMELLAHDVARNEAGFTDHAFVCGVMSLTPALLDMPLKQILAQVSLAAPISDALLSGHGRLGQLLGVVQAMESGDPVELPQKLLELPMLHAAQLSAALAEALRWANHIGEETAA